MPGPSIPIPAPDRIPGAAAAAAIIARESMADARRLGIATVLALLAGGAVVAGAPLAAGAVRVAGVSLAWWYAVVASAGAAGITVLVLAARRAAGAAPEA
jgi:hypothetical protein